MKKPSRQADGFYDSAFGIPDFSPESQPATEVRPPADSSAKVEAADSLVAIDIQSSTTRNQIIATLRGLGVAGADRAEDAALLIVEIGVLAEIRTRLTALRKRARPDAAILVILSRPTEAAIREAHDAGAFACLRPPLVGEELLSLVRASLDSLHARAQLADLTRRLDLEAHLASIGRMSAGLAHEIGSPLQAALTNVDALGTQWADVRDIVEALGRATTNDVPQLVARASAGAENIKMIGDAIEDTHAALRKVRDVIAMMRGLMGRERTVRQERVDVCALVAHARKVLMAELQGVEVELLEEPVFVLADPTLLGQIVQNLVANAAHAAQSLSSPRIRLHIYRSGPSAVISVRDNGPGIPSNLHERIFEPFYTTRRGRGGTGLGLALCREYALQMGATLGLWSLPGRGACFRVTFPRAPDVV